MSERSRPGPGWYADPWRTAQWRYWDGNEWTSQASSSPSPATGKRPRLVHIVLMALGGMALLLGGCSGCTAVLRHAHIYEWSPMDSIDINLRNDTGRTVVVEHCDSNCGPGDSLDARTRLRPGKVDQAGQFERWRTNSFVISNGAGQRIGCMYFDEGNRTNAEYTIPISSMSACPPAKRR
jgi:hypothetical protein